ncbi:hypothetical protein ANCCAN_09672 [Ancylostoma caninum]|uniref:Transthyretin-like family protein n=1 Tax=Ancylostoma caninum TaxID=29170 RepID=A0A368GKX6_ANCCA|nr:hypothetical protein ANCCAN_09672 [Ancylostoma caninum]
MNVSMWHLIAFLACLNVVHAQGQPICPKLKGKAPDFVITAKVVERMEPWTGFIPYSIADVEIRKPKGLTSFESTIYTLKEAPDLFNVTLVPGRCFKLEGEFFPQGKTPIVRGCKLLRKCGGKSKAQ